MKYIIKDGHKTFKKTCDFCGCEFTYDFEDISIEDICVSSGKIECPYCKQTIYHNFHCQPIGYEMPLHRIKVYIAKDENDEL
ncbi:MAG: hypothetical protein NC131_01185 [Roseburia sp.]|nr:hypothetical protein [Roseburia sp.]